MGRLPAVTIPEEAESAPFNEPIIKFDIFVVERYDVDPTPIPPETTNEPEDVFVDVITVGIETIPEAEIENLVSKVELSVVSILALILNSAVGSANED
jgi:hypothetical protein